MTITLNAVNPQQLLALLESEQRPTLIDVRRAAVRQSDDCDITSAQWQDPALWLDWKDSIPTDKPVVVYCAKGHEISQAICATLQALGAQASFLEGGFAAWRATELPVAALNR